MEGQKYFVYMLLIKNESALQFSDEERELIDFVLTVMWLFRVMYLFPVE